MSSHNSVTLASDTGRPVTRLTHKQLLARSNWLERLSRHAEGPQRIELLVRAGLAAVYAFRAPGAVLFGRRINPGHAAHLLGV